MKTLIEKVNELKESLNQTPEVLDIKELNNEIKKDKELLKLLNEYHQYPKEELKKNILDNELFRKYNSGVTFGGGESLLQYNQILEFDKLFSKLKASSSELVIIYSKSSIFFTRA